MRHLILLFCLIFNVFILGLGDAQSFVTEDKSKCKECHARERGGKQKPNPKVDTKSFGEEKLQKQD